MRMIVLAALALALAACQTTTPTTAPRTAVAECRIFQGPPHVIETVTRSGQLYVDEFIEVGVRVCGWDRPGAPSPDEVMKLAPPATATVSACPWDMTVAAREDRSRLERSVQRLRSASPQRLARLRASYGVSRQQFAECIADAEAALR